MLWLQLMKILVPNLCTALSAFEVFLILSSTSHYYYNLLLKVFTIIEDSPGKYFFDNSAVHQGKEQLFSKNTHY